MLKEQNLTGSEFT